MGSLRVGYPAGGYLDQGHSGKLGKPWGTLGSIGESEVPYSPQIPSLKDSITYYTIPYYTTLYYIILYHPLLHYTIP